MTTPRTQRILLACAASCLFAITAHSGPLGYDDTPFLPDGKWRVHDSKRPQPEVITPGTESTQDKAGRPPSDAIVLFDGKDLSNWTGRPKKKVNPEGKAMWTVEKGHMASNRTGDLVSKGEFGSCQIHIEWSAPSVPHGTGQGRGNSGMFIMGRYEIQILDNYENKTYPDGQAASLYGQKPPLVNACRKPGEWQSYDIIFEAPEFKDGKCVKPAYATVLHNGVLMHNHQALLGPTQHKRVAQYAPHADKGPIKLQDHGNPVRYRNIWVRPLKGYDRVLTPAPKIVK